jgi:hypothetical protein
VIKLFFLDNKIVLRQSELPGKEFILQNISSIREEIEKHPVIASALAKLDADLLDYKVERTFEPGIEMVSETR